MVTSATSVKSTRFFLSCGLTLSGKARARAIQASENSCGTLYLRTAISISMPGSSASPSTSMTRPTGCPYKDGASVSSTTTTCPVEAEPVAVFGISTSWPYRLSSGTTIQMPLSSSKRPMMGCLARSVISSTRPSGRPLRSLRTIRTLTRSLCNTARISFWGK